MILRTLLAISFGAGLGVTTALIEIPPILWPIISILGGLIVTYVLREKKEDWFSYVSGATFSLLGWIFFSVFLWPIFFN